jgi:hypothetical protein
MANTNAPFGFRQYSGTGSAPTYEQVPVVIAYNAPAIFFNDPVEPTNAGTVVRGDGTTVAGGIAGIFVGCQYLSVSQKRTVWSNYWPGSDVAATNTVLGYVVNDPNAKFLVQSNSVGITQAEVNSNIGYDIGTGNTANGISGAFVTESSISTSADLPFRIISLVTQPPGSSGTETVAGGYASGAYNWIIVAFNNVTTKTLTSV